MKKQELLSKRLKLLEQLDEQSEKCEVYVDCKMEPYRSDFNPDKVCGGCPLYPKFSEIGDKLIKLTKQYRKDHNIKPMAIDEKMAKKKQAVKINNKSLNAQYDEMKEVATKNGISKPTFIARLKTGMPKEEAATKPVQKRKLSDEQIEIALSNGIPYAAVLKRLGRGWCVEDAISKKLKRR